MWNASLSGASEGARFHAELQKANNNSNNSQYIMEHGTSPSTPAPAWFNWHRYKPQDRFPTPQGQQQQQQQMSTTGSRNPLPGSAIPTNPLRSSTSPRAGAPREVASRTPIIERGGTLDPSAASSLYRQMTPTSIRKTSTLPAAAVVPPRPTTSDRTDARSANDRERILDQEEWSRRFGALSPAATLLPPTRSSDGGNLLGGPASQVTNEMFNRYNSKTNNRNPYNNDSDNSIQQQTDDEEQYVPQIDERGNLVSKRVPGHVTFIHDENDAFRAAVLLPGDRAAGSVNSRRKHRSEGPIPQQLQLQQEQQHLPWVPSGSNSSLAAFHYNNNKNYRYSADGEHHNTVKDDTAAKPLQRGEKLFIVNVVTDPLRLGTVSSSYNSTLSETEHNPNHPKESGPRALAAVSSSRSGGTRNNNSKNIFYSPSFEKSSYIVLRNIRAKSVRGFAEAIENTLAEEHGIFIKLDDGFRFSNFMQSSPWVVVKSLVGDEMLRESRLSTKMSSSQTSNNNKNNYDGESRTSALGAFLASSAALTKHKEKDARHDGGGGDRGSGDDYEDEGDKVLAAVSKAAAAAAGSISFQELPTELTVCPFPSKRRITFQITCSTLNAAGVCIFPLKEEDIILERRGSAWVSDMDQVRQAVSRVTHRDCSKAPMFVLSSTLADASGDKQHPAAPSSSSLPTSTSVIKNYEVGILGLPKCEPLLGPHQLPPFCCLLVTLPSERSSFGGDSSSSSSSFALPDELNTVPPASTSALSLGLPKRIKTPLAAAVIGDDDQMLMAFDHFVNAAKYGGGAGGAASIPLKREELLFSTDSSGELDPSKHYHYNSNSNSKRLLRSVDDFVDDENNSHVYAMRNAASEMMDDFRRKFRHPDVSMGNPQIRRELTQQPARVNVNLIEHVISEGMARFGDYVEAGQLRVPQVFPSKASDFDLQSSSTPVGSSASASNARRNRLDGGAGDGDDGNDENNDREHDPERTATGSHPPAIDEASRALLFGGDFYTDEKTGALRPGIGPSAIRRPYEVTKTRFRRALLQASMHLLRTAQDGDILSTDALVRSTSDIVDIVLRQLETTYGLGETRPFMLPLGKIEIETIKKVAAKAVQLEIAVQVGGGGGGSIEARGRTGVPFFQNDRDSIARVNQERQMMGMRPLPIPQMQQQQPKYGGSGGTGITNTNASAASFGGVPSDKRSNFFEMQANSPGGRALTAAAKSGDEKKEKEIASQLGLPSYEPVAPRKPLDGAVLVLTRPQFDLLTKRIVLFATCSVDIFSVQSAINAMRFHRRTAGELQKTSEASYFRWCVAYGQHTANAFLSYLKNKDAGSLEGVAKPIKEVPLDALIELGLARVDIVSFARPTTLALEISLRRPPTDTRQQQQQQGQQQGQGQGGELGNAVNTRNTSNISNDNSGNNPSTDTSVIDTTVDVLQADERYSIYLEVGDDQGGFIHQALTFILPTSVLHPEEYAAEQRRKSELRRGGKTIPQFEER